MMLCVECGALFEQGKVAVEKHGLDSPPYEEYLVCPSCGGSNLHHARRCDVCNEWITSSYVLTLEGQRICEDCYTQHDVENE